MAAPADERKIFLQGAPTVGRTTFFNKTTALAETLERITATCIQRLKEQQEIAHHHCIIVQWMIQYCSSLGLSPLAIRDPDSWQHKKLLGELKHLPSPYVKALLKQTKQTPWEPLPDLILNDAVHDACVMCDLAKKIQIAIRKKVVELLPPEDPSSVESIAESRVQELVKVMKKWKTCKKLTPDSQGSLARITLVFVDRLQTQQEGHGQHRTMAEWVVRCSCILGDSHAPIKDLSTWIQKFVPRSLYVTFFCAQMEKHPERPPLGLIFENLLHSECSFCETAQAKRMEAEREFLKLLFPGQQLRGPLGSRLERLLILRL